MILCYNEATARDCSSLELDLQLCAQNGCFHLEPRIDMLRRYLEGHTLEELRDAFRRWGIRAQTVNAVYLYRDFLTGRDTPERAQALLGEFLFACRVAQVLGAPGVILVPPMNSEEDGRPFGADSREVEEMLVPALRLLADVAAVYQTGIALEPVGAARSSVRTAKEAARLLALAGRKNTGLAVDAFNLYLGDAGQDYSELLALQGSDVMIAHIADGDGCPWEQVRQRNRKLCGSGELNLAAFLRRLAEIRYNGAVSVETFRPEYWRMPPEDVVNLACSTTRKILEENGVSAGPCPHRPG